MRRSLLRSLRSFAVLTGVLGVFSCGDAPTAPRQVEIAVAAPSTAAITAPALVISQVFGGGGNTGAPYTRDYIEIFNPGSTAVSLTGWSVQYASATGTSWQVTALSGSVAPGGYYLVGESSGAAGVALPTPDASGGIAMAAGAGKVLLASQSTALSGACPTGATVVDLVPFGSTANCPNPTATLTNTTAALRGTAGCTYSGVASADFVAGPPLPRNSATAANTCGGAPPAAPSAVTVAPDSTGVLQGSSVTFTATAKDADGNVVPTTFTWATANSAVATVTSAGVATGVGAGLTTITATSANGISATVKLSVTALNLVNHAGEVVISQIYGGGGNANAIYKNDYVELFNRTDHAVDLTGWSVQYGSATGAFGQPVTIGGSLASGKYLLVALASGGAIGADLPTAEFSGTTNMSGTAGKVLIYQGTTAAGVNCPTGDAVVDMVAYGSGVTCGGSAPNPPSTPNLSATIAATRRSGGCFYTPDASVDFTVIAPAPRNGSTAARSCVVGPLDHVTLTGNAAILAGATTQLSATPLDANDNLVTGATTFWTTSDPTIATVSPTGLVTGIAANATPAAITASITANGVTKSATLEVQVNTDGINWIDVSSSTTSFPPGFQTQLFATARVQSGGTIIPATFSFTSLDPSVMTVQTVNNTAILTGVAAPTDGSKPRLQITATPTGGGSPYTFVSRPVTIEVPVAAPTSNYANNEEFGLPTPASASNADDFLIRRPQYSLSYNQSRGTPNWVSYELDARQMITGQDRCNCFTADPLLPTAKQIFTSDYTNGGFDRGHMARSADRTLANTDNASTFFLTNIVPQIGDLNQGVWAQFENALADSARAGRAVYIITGPLYSRGKALSYVKNEGKIAIPDSTWKVALIGPAGSGSPFTTANVQSWDDLAGLTLMAVNMPNIAGVRNDPWSKYLTTVEKIEEATGYDFLSLLSTGFQPALDYKDHAPVARITTSGNAPAGTAVTFDATTSSDADLGRADLGRPEALTFDWSFSDGSTATGATVGKTFATNGVITATLTVKDAFGWPNVATAQVTIANVAPTATLVAPPSAVEGSPFTFSLTEATDASASDAANLHFAFDCGAGYGDASTASSTTCTPNDNGNVVVKAKVIDPDGAFTEYTATVAVTNVAPTASFTASATVPRGGSIALSLNAPSDVSTADVTAGLSFAFDCGAGWVNAATPATACQALHSGPQIVKGRVSDKDGGASEYTASVTVTPVSPTAVLATSAGVVAEGSAFTIALNGATAAVPTDLPLLQYAFDCGAGYGPLGPISTATCVPSDNGARTVRGKVIDSEGSFSEYLGAVSVTNVAPTASFTAPTNTTRGLTFDVSLAGMMDPSSDDIAAGFTFAFDCGLGYGLSSATSTATCTALHSGTMTVRGKLTDKDGGSSEYTRTVSVADPIVMAALTRRTPTLNGRLEGDAQLLSGENVTLNGNSTLTGKLFVPGTPTVRQNGNPSFGGTSDAAGSLTPTGYTVTINGNSMLGALVRRTDAVNLPIVAGPAAPTGSREVTLNKSTDLVGDWATVRKLTLNGNVGSIAMPGGAYGQVTINSGNTLVLGTAGATTPTVYDFEALTLNGQSAIQVVGPVIVTIRGGVNVNGLVGNAEHPEWLGFRSATDGITLNGGARLFGQVFAPSGTVTINGGSQLTGALAADRLVLNGNALLKVTIGVAVP